MPSSLKTINVLGETIMEDAFCHLNNVTSITIPEGVTSIGSNAFEYCSGLTSITIPNSVTSIGSEAFYGCTSLTSITIPDSVTSIGNYAFRACTSLTSVNITDINAWCKISFGGNTGTNPNYYAKNLLLNGESITEVVLDSSVTKIPAYAFYGCTSLTSITIPDSVTSIEDYPFKGCSNLASITILAEAPATLHYSIFRGVPTDYIIYVPAGSVNAYKSASYWCYYADRIQAIPES